MMILAEGALSVTNFVPGKAYFGRGWVVGSSFDLNETSNFNLSSISWPCLAENHNGVDTEICHISLLWRHNGRDGVLNHRRDDCILNRLFSYRSKNTSKFRVTGLCAGKSPGPRKFSPRKASNTGNVSIWWRQHVCFFLDIGLDVFSSLLAQFSVNLGVEDISSQWFVLVVETSHCFRLGIVNIWVINGKIHINNLISCTIVRMPEMFAMVNGSITD